MLDVYRSLPTSLTPQQFINDWRDTIRSYLYALSSREYPFPMGSGLAAVSDVWQCLTDGLRPTCRSFASCCTCEVVTDMGSAFALPSMWVPETFGRSEALLRVGFNQWLDALYAVGSGGSLSPPLCNSLGCVAGSTRVRTRHLTHPPLLHFRVYEMDVIPLREFRVEGWDGSRRTYGLAALSYLKNAHYTSRFVDLHGVVWAHDGQLNSGLAVRELLLAPTAFLLPELGSDASSGRLVSLVYTLL